MILFPYAMFQAVTSKTYTPTFTDAFTYSDTSNFEAAQGATYGAQGDFQWRISTNRLGPSISTGGYGFLWVLASNTIGDQYSKIKVLSGVNSEWVGACVRTNQFGNSYYVMCSVGSGGSNEFGCMIGGVQTTWSTAGNIVQANDVIRIEIIGTTISWYINNVLQASHVDTNLTYGSAGVCGYSQAQGSLLDDLEIGSIS